jgi:hypothetical protein
VTALEEVGTILSSHGDIVIAARYPPWAVFAVEGFLSEALDLTDPFVQTQLGTSVAELTGDWRYSQTLFLAGKGLLPPTQLLGKLAFESGRFVAIRYPSAKRTGRGLGVAVLADRLKATPPSYLEVYDPHRRIRQRIP